MTTSIQSSSIGGDADDDDDDDKKININTGLLVNAISIELRLGRLGVVHVLQAGELVHAHGLQVRVVLVGERRVHLVHGHGVHRGHLVLLLPLHPPVLEPDLDLPLRQAQRVRDLDPSPPGQVAVEVELLLQLQGLITGVGRPLPLGLAVLIHGI